MVLLTILFTLHIHTHSLPQPKSTLSMETYTNSNTIVTYFMHAFVSTNSLILLTSTCHFRAFPYEKVWEREV
ncbi:hypothetical protein AAZX31_08G181400 [Glycine max]